jgi:hypothetical protein
MLEFSAIALATVTELDSLLGRLEGTQEITRRPIKLETRLDNIVTARTTLYRYNRTSHFFVQDLLPAHSVLSFFDKSQQFEIAAIAITTVSAFLSALASFQLKSVATESLN